MRLARPSVLVNLGAVDGLAGMERADGHVLLGPMTRQRAVETSADVAAVCPMLVEAIRHIGHVQIRNRGTIGGSLAHADPAAELPAVALALGAEMVVRSSQGGRVVLAEELFDGHFTTTLQPDELLMEVRVPVTEGRQTAFVEVARRTGDFALAGIAAVVRFEPGSARVAEIGLTALGVGPARSGCAMPRPQYSGPISTTPRYPRSRGSGSRGEPGHRHTRRQGLPAPAGRGIRLPGPPEERSWLRWLRRC